MSSPTYPHNASYSAYLSNFIVSQHSWRRPSNSVPSDYSDSREALSSSVDRIVPWSALAAGIVSLRASTLFGIGKVAGKFCLEVISVSVVWSAFSPRFRHPVPEFWFSYCYHHSLPKVFLECIFAYIYHFWSIWLSAIKRSFRKTMKSVEYHLQLN